MISIYKKFTAYDIDYRETERNVIPVSLQEYDLLGKTDKYYGNHDRYHKMYAPIIDAILDLPKEAFAKPILEVGCYKLQFFKDSVTMDNVQSRTKPVIHDASISPWPFQSNRFGVCIMSHILEHVDNPRRAIVEACRVSDWIVIALPLNWVKGANKNHEDINQETLYNWMRGLPTIPWLLFESKFHTQYEQFVAIFKVDKVPIENHNGRDGDPNLSSSV